MNRPRDGSMVALLASYRPANDLALSLFALSETVFPAEWNDEINEILVRDLVTFSTHTRRLIQTTFLRDQAIAIPRPHFGDIQYGAEPNWLDDFQRATGVIIHYTTMTVSYVGVTGRERFKDTSRNHVPMLARVKSNKQTEFADINVNGMALAFLTHIKPALQRAFPDEI